MSEDMESLLRGHRRYFAEGRTRDVRFRAETLRRLRKALRDHTDALCEALRLDLHKSASESYLTEIGIVLQEIACHLRRLKRWTAGRRVPSPLTILPSGSRIVPEPLGVVLIVAPWNYPVQLLLNPLVGALSAGNCAVLKSSPLVPHTEALLKRLIGEVFPPGYVSFLEGGPEVVEEVLKQRFDSIFFTGGSAFGQTVMRAAAEHLTPLTLELGGKSPCIVGRDADIPLAARRIVWGKLLNAGQTCVAPDYLFVHADRKRQLCVEMERAVRRFFGDDPRLSDDYPRIVSVQAAERLQRMMPWFGKDPFRRNLRSAAALRGPDADRRAGRRQPGHATGDFRAAAAGQRVSRYRNGDPLRERARQTAGALLFRRTSGSRPGVALHFVGRGLRQRYGRATGQRPAAVRRRRAQRHRKVSRTVLVRTVQQPAGRRAFAPVDRYSVAVRSVPQYPVV